MKIKIGFADTLLLNQNTPKKLVASKFVFKSHGSVTQKQKRCKGTWQNARLS